MGRNDEMGGRWERRKGPLDECDPRTHPYPPPYPFAPLIALASLTHSAICMGPRAYGLITAEKASSLIVDGMKIVKERGKAFGRMRDT